MRPIWDGTRVSGPCVVTVGNLPPVAAVCIYGRNRDGDRLDYSVHTVMAEPFAFNADAELVSSIAHGVPAVANTTIGAVSIRPLMAGDASWLPASTPIGHSAEMLAELLQAIDSIECFEDNPAEPFTEDEIADGPIEEAELLIATAQHEVRGMRWMARGEGSWRSRTWVRIGEEWIEGSDTGYESGEASGESARTVHPFAYALLLKAFDAGTPLSALSVELACPAFFEETVFAGDLPRGAAKELADEWLASGGDPKDILVSFGNGTAELEVELVLEASLDKDRRTATRGQRT